MGGGGADSRGRADDNGAAGDTRAADGAGGPDGESGEVEDRHLFSTRFERGVLLVGLALAVALAVEIFAIRAVDPALGRALITSTLTGLFMGREAGIPTGLALGVPPWLMLQASATLDLASGATGYGAVVRLVDRPNRLSTWARGYLAKTEEDARAQQGFLRRWGRLGAFLFMLVPFMVNGPLVVATAGRLSGLRSRDLAFPIASATVVAAAVWVAFAATLLSLIRDVAPGLEVAATGVFLGAMLGFAIYRFFRVQKQVRARRDREDRAAERVASAADDPSAGEGAQDEGSATDDPGRESGARSERSSRASGADAATSRSGRE